MWRGCKKMNDHAESRTLKCFFVFILYHVSIIFVVEMKARVIMSVCCSQIYSFDVTQAHQAHPRKYTISCRKDKSGLYCITNIQLGTVKSR